MLAQIDTNGEKYATGLLLPEGEGYFGKCLTALGVGEWVNAVKDVRLPSNTVSSNVAFSLREK